MVDVHSTDEDVMHSRLEGKQLVLIKRRKVGRKVFSDQRLCSIPNVAVNIFTRPNLAEVVDQAGEVDDAVRAFLLDDIAARRLQGYRAFIGVDAVGFSRRLGKVNTPKTLTHLLNVVLDAAGVLGAEFPKESVVGLLRETIGRLNDSDNAAASSIAPNQTMTRAGDQSADLSAGVGPIAASVTTSTDEQTLPVVVGILSPDRVD